MFFLNATKEKSEVREVCLVHKASAVAEAQGRPGEQQTDGMQEEQQRPPIVTNVGSQSSGSLSCYANPPSAVSPWGQRDIQGEIGESIIMVGDFKSSRQKTVRTELNSIESSIKCL